MKKIVLILALGLSLSAALAACNKEDPASSASAASGSMASSAASESGATSAPASSAASAVSSAAPASASPASATVSSAAASSGSAGSMEATSGAAGSGAASSTAAPAAAPAPTNFAGTYNSYDTERYPDDRAPYLELSDKGGFVLHFNLGDGRLAVMTGTYVNSGGGLEMDVMYCDSTDFLGQDIIYLSFTQDGTNNLVYNSAPLGMTRSGDVFTRKGAMGGTGSDGMGGKNMYILEPGQVLEGGLPLSGNSAATSRQAAPAATASVSAASPAPMATSGV